MLYRLARIFIMVVFGAGSFALANTLTVERVAWPLQIEWAVLGASALVAALLGYLLAPWIIRSVVGFTSFIETGLNKLPTQDIVSGAAGAVIGLIIASLLGLSFSGIPVVGVYFPVIFSVILGYLGWSVGVKKKEELAAFCSNLPIFGKDRDKGKGSAAEASGAYKILDTSVIIDGRIADICKSGFLDGVLIIPGFVLEELRHIADSSDLLKRNRGRRGLDILNRMRKEMDINVKIHEQDYSDIEEVDSKLVRLAQDLGGRVVTNDYNLNKVAQLQGVPVLNINDLANAVKPVVLPGEEMNVRVIKEGKEAGQGVGYLDDGTMIVVEKGKNLIGDSVTVVVTSVLQTSAGRMIFVKPKSEVSKEEANKEYDQRSSMEMG